LAGIGQSLYGTLVTDYIDRSPAARALRKSEFLQIVSAQPGAIVPLEFVYEYVPPRDDASVCPNAGEALKRGKCPGSCVPKEGSDGLADHVCPMGFWGLRKVIERHDHDPSLGIPAKVYGVEPTAKRGTLPARGPSLLAISNNVTPSSRKKELAEQVERLWNGEVTVAETWAGWRKILTKTKPVLFVVLPHVGGRKNDPTLEIHGDSWPSRLISGGYLKPDAAGVGPIVILLGCDTADARNKDAYAKNIDAFRRAGAEIVLASAAESVWGADAATVAGQVLEAFHNATTGTRGSFGEVVRTAKRRSVAESQLVAMSLTAFGDADWRLKL
jgi:hypothetical protein